MAAQTAPRKRKFGTFKQLSLILANTKVAFDGAIAAINLTNGQAHPGEVNANLKPIGNFIGCAEAGTTGNGTLKVAVRLHREIFGEWFANDGADPVLASHLGQTVYILDDNTVSSSHDTNARSAAGTAWAVDAAKGVFVEYPI